ncbi:hypothetical protein PHK61_11265 [Actinomycetospora lutea]|uniref:hypothetical protein n=1 Tax=Actinomycetospora lutea TaxID=663604 RepID=UPI00236731E9|nr:hypothetical protein [Actinomycetospora lutea]MDD7938993.1 hypothetical protein [Actinomycetospora lutea]
MPGEAVSPSVARAAATRDEAARKAAKADRRRRRRRVLLIFLVALLAVAAVWIVPRLIALALAVVTALGGGSVVVPADDPTTPVAAASAAGADLAAAPAPRQELPRGGTTIAPEHRVVVLRATPGVSAEETADRVEATATAFGTSDRDALPAVELPVADGGRGGAAWQQLALTRAHRQLLVLAVPTGPTRVVEAVAPWERLLREPDVGLALDTAMPLPPEELGAVTGWLADVVRSADLPQKLLVVTGPISAVPAELAVVAIGEAGPPALRGTVLPLGGPGAREVLATPPAPDVVLYR